jgi:hypothetical protein
MIRLVVVLILAVSLVSAQQSERRDGLTALRASQAVMVTGHGLDLLSCGYGCPEANPLLATDGRMGVKGIAVKVGVAAGLVLVQNWWVRRWPGSRRVWTQINFVMGGTTAAVAARNWRMP